MLRIEAKHATTRRKVSDRGSDPDGLLFLGAWVASWILAIAVGWLVWQVAPL